MKLCLTYNLNIDGSGATVQPSGQSLRCSNTQYSFRQKVTSLALLSGCVCQFEGSQTGRRLSPYSDETANWFLESPSSYFAWAYLTICWFLKDSLVDICWERAELLAFRLCCFTLCRLDFLFLWGRKLISIVSVPDHCLFIYSTLFAHWKPKLKSDGRKTSPRTSTIVRLLFIFGPLRSAWIFWEIRNKWLV